jgi:hypothetical protein
MVAAIAFKWFIFAVILRQDRKPQTSGVYTGSTMLSLHVGAERRVILNLIPSRQLTVTCREATGTPQRKCGRKI